MKILIFLINIFNHQNKLYFLHILLLFKYIENQFPYLKYLVNILIIIITIKLIISFKKYITLM